jgi:hypothetical protein
VSGLVIVIFDGFIEEFHALLAESNCFFAIAFSL